MNERELHEWLLDLQLQNKQLKEEKEGLLNEIDELKDDIEFLQDKIQHIEQDVEDNYRRIPVSEQVGISDRDFI